MRHRRAGRRFDMDSTQRKAMFRNMVTSLLLHGTIRTTEMRAKELRRFAEPVITIARRAPSVDGLEGEELRVAKADRVAAIRRARLWVNDDDAMKKLFNDYGPRFKSRAGGSTRVVKAGRRPGDNASMAVIQILGADEG